MDDEELEKNEDTQTSTDNANETVDSNNSQDANKSKNAPNNDEKDTDESKTNQDDKVANAFGNKSETKKEDDKGKKTNTVAKKNTDGSITFKNQEELNGFIDRMIAKGAKKTINNETQTEENKSIEQDESIDTTENEQLNNKDTNTAPNFIADIALSMIEGGVDAKKARRVARLVDTNKIIVDGQLDEAKLKEEVEAILSDFPEFKSSQPSEETEKGFKFGAGKQAYTDSNEDLISGIFGNK